VVNSYGIYSRGKMWRINEEIREIKSEQTMRFT